jgi:hypothetical protein
MPLEVVLDPIATASTPLAVPEPIAMELWALAVLLLPIAVEKIPDASAKGPIT